MKRAEINDEVLSAFMDRELDEAVAFHVREAIKEDAALGERLAELTRADELVRTHAHALDNQPLPAELLQRLESSQSLTQSRVIPVDFMRRRFRRGLQLVQRHQALAASVVIMLRLVAFVVSRGADQAVPNMSEYASDLASSMSGETITLDGSNTLITRFSFQHENGHFCRQYRLQARDQNTENIACRGGEGWVVIASLDAALADGGEYQPASQLPAMDSLLDAMMQGAPLSLTEEKRLIQNDWQGE